MSLSVLERCVEMARLSAMAASSHHLPCRPPSPPPHHSHSPSSVSVAAWVCPNAAATNWDSGLSSSSPPPSVIGGVWRRRTNLSATSSCFGEESTPPTSPRLRHLLFCHNLWERNRNGSLRLSLWRTTTSSIYCRGAGKGAQMEVERVEPEDQDEDPRLLALEAELYDFMQKSSKPTHFPTQDELIAAGRKDLVKAIAEYGGWLAYGGDFDDDDEATNTNGGSSDDEGEDGDNKEKDGPPQGEWRPDAISSLPLQPDSPATVAMEHNEFAVGRQDNRILQQQREVDLGEESGIKGILNRLEKERTFSYLDADKKVPSKNKNNDSGTAGSQVVPYGNIYGVDNMHDIHMDDLLKQSDNDMRSGSNKPGNDQECIHSRLQFLGTELGSVLSSLRSSTDAVVPHKGQEGSLMELHKLSDTLEFQETEIMNAQYKLRSVRAKLAAFEGKMALDIVEAQKIVEEKQKRIDAAQKSLCLIRTAYVVWPNSASAVLLAGSFDGWSSQMKMEKLSTGIFFLYLKLYPGQYEIKFIIDGSWKIDPLHPIVYNNGYENNLLTIR